MAAVNYCKNKPLPDKVKIALLDLVDRLDCAYLRLDGTYGDLDKIVSDKLRYIHNLMDKGDNHVHHSHGL